MKPRILQIIPSLDLGEAETQLSLLATGLPMDRFEVHACALDHGGLTQEQLDRRGIPTSVIGKSWNLDPLAYQRLKQFIRKLQPDLVHTWNCGANDYGRAAAHAAGVKQIVAREQDGRRASAGYRAAIDRRLTRWTNRIVTNSAAVSEAWVRRGFPKEKFQVISNAVDYIDGKGRGSKQQLCDQLVIPADSRLILTVGRLCSHKRIKDLIWATDLLKCVRDDTHLLIVGEGPQQWRLDRYRRQCEITERVHFLGRRDDVPELLPLCDCFWSASDSRGQSNGIMEAMAAGLPVVASDTCDNQQLVNPRETGFLVTVGDRAAFAKWTNVLLGDDQLAGEMGRRGQRRMREHFSVNRMVERYAQLYDELLN